MQDAVTIGEVVHLNCTVTSNGIRIRRLQLRATT
jgi:hypothetical protein